MQIAEMSHQEMLGVDQVAIAMGNIREASEQNVNNAKQMENAARDLHELGQKLKQQIDNYKL